MSRNFFVTMSISVSPTSKRDMSRKAQKARHFGILQNVDLVRKPLLILEAFSGYFPEIEWRKGIVTE